MQAYNEMFSQPTREFLARRLFWREIPTLKAVKHLPNVREFKKLRRQRYIKIKLCVKLSLLRLLHVDHVVQNRWSALSLAWYEWLRHVKAKGERFTPVGSRCRQNLKYENFTSSFGRLRQNIATKSVPHVQHDCFSSFNQSNHWFVVLSLTLPSSNLKLPIIILKEAKAGGSKLT